MLVGIVVSVDVWRFLLRYVLAQHFAYLYNVDESIVKIENLKIDVLSDTGTAETNANYRLTVDWALLRDPGTSAPITNLQAARGLMNSLSFSLCDESMSGTGSDYRGCQSSSKTGKACVKWAPGVDFTITLGKGNNFCRNPPGPTSMSTIWCYTTGKRGCTSVAYAWLYVRNIYVAVPVTYAWLYP